MQKITGPELDAIIDARRAEALAGLGCCGGCAQARAHRALPLSEVDAQAQARRMPWPGCSQNCNQGRACSCTPAEAGSAVSEFLADPPKPRPPAVPWRELGAGLLVLLFTLSCLHVIVSATQPATGVTAR